jgi:hypothetical protein
MGIYLNPGTSQFQEAVTREIYVDKSMLIDYMNYAMDKGNKYVCVSRPRRFGKSTDANMLVAYYTKDADSSSLFEQLKISQAKSYSRHLNRHLVIHVDMQNFLSVNDCIENMIHDLTECISYELFDKYPDIRFFKKDNLSRILLQIHAQTHDQFVFIIDEWDCVFREYKFDKKAQEQYLDFLRLLFKGQPYVSFVYMTGILPIKKYGTHSALNMFKEISMLNPTPLEAFMGFTESEVKNLCEQYHMDYEEMQSWYNGYHFNDGLSIYSPRSVISAIEDHKFGNYWTNTETYEALKVYIDMNFDGLKDAIVKLLAGERVNVNTTKFQNDMTTFDSKDDVFTLLIHLGYLGYDETYKQVYIPNYEVTDSFVNSIETSDWKETTKALQNSRDLLEATWKQDADRVAEYIQESHLHTSILQYNDENALSYTLLLAYYTARDYYTIIREMPSGKGYADLVFLPKKSEPAMVVELKWNKEVKTAIDQIRGKNYIHGLEKYLGNLLLVGITYDKNTKEHKCLIERYEG